MRFEINPQLIVTKDEMETLDKALQLCQDMDNLTEELACANCPRNDDCSRLPRDCMFARASDALIEIIDTIIVK